MSRARVVVVAVVIVVLAVGGLVLAIGGDDDGGPPLTESDLAGVLRDNGTPAEQADCMAAEAYDRLTEDELAQLRERDEGDALAPELRRKLEAAVAPCASAGS